MFSLQAVADYLRTKRAPKLLRLLLAKPRHIITFEEEHANRPPRFIEIVNDYKAGVLITAIEAKYGCSRNTIFRYARLANLPKRARGDAERRAAIIAAYQVGKPIAEIAVTFGISQALVSRIATEAGINRYRKRR